MTIIKSRKTPETPGVITAEAISARIICDGDIKMSALLKEAIERNWEERKSIVATPVNSEDKKGAINWSQVDIQMVDDKIPACSATVPPAVSVSEQETNNFRASLIQQTNANIAQVNQPVPAMRYTVDIFTASDCSQRVRYTFTKENRAATIVVPLDHPTTVREIIEQAEKMFAKNDRPV